MTTTLPAPAHVVQRLTDLANSWTSCTRDGDHLIVDTPFPLQDGHLLRAYISVGEERGDLVVSDGGWAAEQVELFTARTSLDARWVAMAQIARESGLEWDIEFNYRAANLDDAVGGLSRLARAVDRTLTTLAPTVSRVRTSLRARLRDEMRSAGLQVQHRPLITVGQQDVRVDYRVSRDHVEAAVEVLGGQTDHGATQSIDRAVTNFHLLQRGQYHGLLAAIFDEDSEANRSDIRKRFTDASPADTLLISSSEAVSVLRQHLAA